jgi:hypothetical protein
MGGMGGLWKVHGHMEGEKQNSMKMVGGVCGWKDGEIMVEEQWRVGLKENRRKAERKRRVFGSKPAAERSWVQGG